MEAGLRGRDTIVPASCVINPQASWNEPLHHSLSAEEEGKVRRGRAESIKWKYLYWVPKNLAFSFGRKKVQFSPVSKIVKN